LIFLNRAQQRSSPGETDEFEVEEGSIMKSNLIKFSSATIGAALSAAVFTAATPSSAQAKDKTVWKKVELPTRETLFDKYTSFSSI